MSRPEVPGHRAWRARSPSRRSLGCLLPIRRSSGEQVRLLTCSPAWTSHLDVPHVGQHDHDHDQRPATPRRSRPRGGRPTTAAATRGRRPRPASPQGRPQRPPSRALLPRGDSPLLLLAAPARTLATVARGRPLPAGELPVRRSRARCCEPSLHDPALMCILRVAMVAPQPHAPGTKDARRWVPPPRRRPTPARRGSPRSRSGPSSDDWMGHSCDLEAAPRGNEPARDLNPEPSDYKSRRPPCRAVDCRPLHTYRFVLSGACRLVRREG